LRAGRPAIQMCAALWKRLIAGAGLFGAGIFLAANPHHLVSWFLD
jgi:hypothetical protein